MLKVWLIAQRELSAYFKTWMGYIIVFAALIIDGLLFNVFAIGDKAKYSAEVAVSTCDTSQCLSSLPSSCESETILRCCDAPVVTKEDLREIDSHCCDPPHRIQHRLIIKMYGILCPRQPQLADKVEKFLTLKHLHLNLCGVVGGLAWQRDEGALEQVEVTPRS